MLTREWRNWQTRTFEGRVVTPYGFKSRFSHQKQKDGKSRPFCFSYKLTTPNPSNSQELDCFAQEFLYTLVYGAQSWVLKSRFSHQKDTDGKSRPFLFAAKQTTTNPSAACGGRATLSVLQSKCAAVPRKDNSPLRLRSRFNFVPFLAP